MPVHVILRVGAALESTIRAQTSTKMQTNVRRVDIATYPTGRYEMCDFTVMGMEAAIQKYGLIDL